MSLQANQRGYSLPGAGVTQKQLIVYSLPLHGENSESCNLELRAYLWAALLAAECLFPSNCSVSICLQEEPD